MKYIFILVGKVIPSIEALFGSIVTAPSAISSCWSTGVILEPQLSEPIQRKCPLWLPLFADSKILLKHNKESKNCY